MRIKRKQLLNIGIHAILIITLIAVAFPIYFLHHGHHTIRMPTPFHPSSSPATSSFPTWLKLGTASAWAWC